MEEKSLQELIEQLREENEIEKTYLKKQLILLKIVMIAMLGTFLVLFITVVTLVPTAAKTLQQANQVIGQISNTMVEVEEVFDSVKILIEESQQGLSIAIDSMNTIDFDGLNKSITDLGNIVSPMANLFSKFR